jgi:hypothetical protein
LTGRASGDGLEARGLQAYSLHGTGEYIQ